MYEPRGRVFQDRAQRSRGRIAGRILPASDRPATVMRFAERARPLSDGLSSLLIYSSPRFLNYHHLNEADERRRLEENGADQR